MRETAHGKALRASWMRPPHNAPQRPAALKAATGARACGARHACAVRARTAYVLRPTARDAMGRRPKRLTGLTGCAFRRWGREAHAAADARGRRVGVRQAQHYDCAAQRYRCAAQRWLSLYGTQQRCVLCGAASAGAPAALDAPVRAERRLVQRQQRARERGVAERARAHGRRALLQAVYNYRLQRCARL